MKKKLLGGVFGLFVLATVVASLFAGSVMPIGPTEEELILQVLQNPAFATDLQVFIADSPLVTASDVWGAHVAVILKDPKYWDGILDSLPKAWQVLPGVEALKQVLVRGGGFRLLENWTHPRGAWELFKPYDPNNTWIPPLPGSDESGKSGSGGGGGGHGGLPRRAFRSDEWALLQLLGQLLLTWQFWAVLGIGGSALALLGRRMAT